MTRAHFYTKVTDDQGNVVPGTQVTIYQPGTLTLLEASLFDNEVGSTTLPNPFVVNDGIIDFYLDRPGQVKVGVRASNGTERTFDDQDVYPDPHTVVQAIDGLRITNIPQAGNFLQAIGAQEATWVTAPELETAALSEVQYLRQQIFSTQSLGDLTLRTASGASASPIFTNVSGDTKPPGFSFTHALDWNTSQRIIATVPTALFVESGLVQFLYKVTPPTADKTAATLRITLDEAPVWSQTASAPEQYDTWLVGYLANIPPGTYTVRIHHIPGTDPASRVLLGSLVMRYGGQVPPHAHEGAGVLSTAVGTSASANFEAATAVGSMAVAGGTSGTAIGAHAVAMTNGTAVGSRSTAGDGAVAVGHMARTSPGATDAVALGLDASVQGAAGVALGSSALVTAARGVALGSSTRAGEWAVAVGPEAIATAIDSVAIGVGATAVHARSVALGPGAQSTQADQVVLGTAQDTTVIPGNLRQSGDVSLGTAGSTLGFFGEAGTTRPTVTGSRGGNAVLATLIAHLADLGLIIDDTTP